MPRHVPVPPALLERPFTVADGLRLGVPRAVLDEPRFRRPVRGVRVSRDLPDDLWTRASAAGLVLPNPWALRGTSAASVWTLPLPRSPRGSGPADPGVLEVVVASGTRAPERAGIRARQGYRSDACTRVRGIEVVSPCAMPLDLAGELGLDDLVVLTDAVLRRHSGRTEIAAAIEACGAVRGVRRAREALSLARPRVDSAMETRVRLGLLRAGLPEPVTGYTVTEQVGWLGVVDLAYPRWRIAIEYDGEHHGWSRQWQHDLAKTAALRDHGWEVFRICAQDVYPRMDRFVDRLTLAIAQRG